MVNVHFSWAKMILFVVPLLGASGEGLVGGGRGRPEACQLKVSWERGWPSGGRPSSDDWRGEIRGERGVLLWRAEPQSGSTRGGASFTLLPGGLELSCGYLIPDLGAELLHGPHRFPSLPLRSRSPSVRLSARGPGWGAGPLVGVGISFTSKVLSGALLLKTDEPDDSPNETGGETGPVTQWPRVGVALGNSRGERTRWLVNWGDFGGLRSASFSLDTRRPGDRFGFAIVRDGKGKASFETLLSRDLPPSSLDFHLRRFPGGAFYRDQWSGRWKELGGKGLWEAMVDVRLSVGSGVRVTMSQGLRRRAAGRTLHPLTAGRGESRLKIIWQGSKWSLSGTLRRRRESGTRDSSSVTKLGLSLTRSSGGHTLSALAELSAKGGQPPNSAASGSPPRAEAEDDPPVGFVVGLRLRGRCRGKNIRLGAHFFAPGPPGGTLYCYQAGVEQGRTRAIRGPGSSFWLVVDTPIPRTRALLRFGWALMRQGEGGWDGRLGVRWHGKGS